MSGYIDVHHHILPEQYVEIMGAERIGSQGSSGRLPFWSIEDALTRMDAAGIATAITSVSAPGLDVSPKEVAIKLARTCNEVAIEMTLVHSHRFGWFATLPLTSIDAALKETTFAFDQGGADGVCLLSNHQGRYLGEVDMWPLYEELNRRSAVVFVHPTSPLSPVPIAGLSLSSLDFMFDTARAVASLIFMGVLQRFPNIRFIFSHMGGAMPYIAERIGVLAQNNKNLLAFIPNGVRAELAKCYFDTALSSNDITFAAMQNIAGISNIVFGSDYPFGPKNQMTDAIASLAQCGLTQEQLYQVARGNAERLFPRFYKER